MDKSDNVAISEPIEFKTNKYTYADYNGEIRLLLFMDQELSDREQKIFNLGYQLGKKEH